MNNAGGGGGGRGGEGGVGWGWGWAGRGGTIKRDEQMNLYEAINKCKHTYTYVTENSRARILQWTLLPGQPYRSFLAKDILRNCIRPILFNVIEVQLRCFCKGGKLLQMLLTRRLCNCVCCQLPLAHSRPENFTQNPTALGALLPFRAVGWCGILKVGSSCVR